MAEANKLNLRGALPSGRKFIFVVCVLPLISCGKPRGDAAWANCLVGTDTRSTCIAQRVVEKEDPAYVWNTCRSGGGILKDECPAENLIGYCEVSAAAPTSKGFKPRQIRSYQYAHPDLLNPDLVASVAKQCNGNWVPAPPAQEGD
jgi:hypothetical protein